jgi:hypothetical protein
MTLRLSGGGICVFWAKLLAAIHGVEDAFHPNRVTALFALKCLRIG